MKRRYRKIGSDQIFDIFNVFVMILLIVIFVYPLWFVLIASFSEPNGVWKGEVVFFPKELSLLAYKTLIEYKSLWTGYLNTIIYTIAGTALNMVMTVCAAYPLSRKDFKLRTPLLILLMITMYFHGGMIPNYLLMSSIGLLDTRWAIIISGACSVYNVLIVRNYFSNSIPFSLQEAATIDGANSFQYLIKIVLPLSKPVLAVVGLYYAVGHWNDFYTALLYIYDKNLAPLQTVLRELLLSTKLVDSNMNGSDVTDFQEKLQLAQTMKYSIIIASSLPVLCIYPFIQKYFVKGVMVGSVKG